MFKCMFLTKPTKARVASLSVSLVDSESVTYDNRVVEAEAEAEIVCAFQHQILMNQDDWSPSKSYVITREVEATTLEFQMHIFYHLITGPQKGTTNMIFFSE